MAIPLSFRRATRSLYYSQESDANYRDDAAYAEMPIFRSYAEKVQKRRSGSPNPNELEPRPRLAATNGVVAPNQRVVIILRMSEVHAHQREQVTTTSHVNMEPHRAYTWQ